MRQASITDLKLFTVETHFGRLVPEYISRNFMLSWQFKPNANLATEFPINDGKTSYLRSPNGCGKTEFAEIIAARMIALAKWTEWFLRCPLKAQQSDTEKLNEDLVIFFQLPTNLAMRMQNGKNLSQYDSPVRKRLSNDVIRWLFQENKRCFLAPVSVVTIRSNRTRRLELQT